MSSIKEGYLTKQGGLVRSWRRRWFILHGSNLSYYKTKGDPIPAGTIQLRAGTCSVQSAARKIGRNNAFELVTEDRVYNLFADDKATMDSWISHIQAVLNQVEANTIKKSSTITTVIRVKGMLCERCVHNVQKVVFNVTKLDDVIIDPEEELVTIIGKFNVPELQEELEEAGFIPTIISK